MENDHLSTRAAIPYRDPTGKATSIEIKDNREKEQKQSNLKQTSSWKKHWMQTNFE